MSFNFEDLNINTRNKMLEEINLDISKDNLYFSTRFSQKGIDDYQEILIKHVTQGNELSLGDELRLNGRFNTIEQTIRGPKKVPFNAHETFSEGEFNRFYVRALCVIALDSGKKLQVYRAKDVATSRSASISKIGEIVNPSTLLEDLRANIGIDTALGLPSGPNSGLSVKIV